MGVQVSGSWLIIAFATLAAVGTAYPVVANGLEDLADGVGSSMADDDRQLGTAIEFDRAEWNGSHLEVRINNTGDESLAVDETDLFVDGVYRPPDEWNTSEVDGDSDTDLWLQEEQLRIVVEASAPDRVKVVTRHGVSITTTDVVSV